MSRVCQVTGRKPSFGNNVSHSHRKTRRRWNVNVQKHRYWVPSEKRWVTLRVSAKGMKTINRHGIEKVLADMRRRGVMGILFQYHQLHIMTSHFYMHYS